ncbi:hypothetical protein [Flavobacterium hungaricum]|uniref:Holin-X, holin superfamily III n=1 Tax=Flavobacterium hungaricum TaxID=2082725 RepID=A0ABR9TFV2_9FLAO|nr:hypothetical protein [Flavobacterium hungaricum]MBE8724235.1 hypothetical protein [Flavobacterium hungaricum]
MNILKKIAGAILFVLAIILSIGTLLNFISAILIKSAKEFQKALAIGIGFLSATIVFTFLLVLLIRFMFKLSLRLLRNKQVDNDPLEEIGKL